MKTIDTDPNFPLWFSILSMNERDSRDEPTGVYNRRYFEKTLADHIEAAKRYGRNLSLVLFDIDNFKQINNTNGHAKGDSVLKHFAELLKTTARQADMVCRYGDDEFAVILPETGNANALKFIEQVRKKQKTPTVTAGVASLPSKNLIADADQDLIAKKKNPGDR